MRVLKPLSLLAVFTGFIQAGSLLLTPGSIFVQQLAFPPAGTLAQFTTSGTSVGTLATAGFGDIPESMTVLNGQLYVGDGAGRVNAIDLSTGNVASYFGTASFGLNSLGNYNGNLLALEVAFPSTISVFSTGGALLQTITLASIPAGADWNGITSDGTTLYLADYASGRIYKYSSAGSLLGFIDTKLGSGLTGVSFDSSNSSLWVADSQTGQAYDFSTSGVLLSQFSVGLDPNAGIAVVPSSAPEPPSGLFLLGSFSALILFWVINKRCLKED